MLYRSVIIKKFPYIAVNLTMYQQILGSQDFANLIFSTNFEKRLRTTDLIKRSLVTYAVTQGFSTCTLSFTPWKISKVKFNPQIFFILSFLQMPTIVRKSMNFLRAKFTHKTGQIKGVNLPPVENPRCNWIALSR